MHIEIVNSIFMEDPPQGVYNHEALYYIAKSIDVMGKVDAVYFAYDWATARGCRIERQIAQEYGVKILEYDFLDEFKDGTTVRTFDKPIFMPCENLNTIPETPYKITCENKDEPKLKWNTSSKPLTEKEIEDMKKLNDEMIKNTTFRISKGEMPY